MKRITIIITSLGLIFMSQTGIALTVVSPRQYKMYSSKSSDEEVEKWAKWLKDQRFSRKEVVSRLARSGNPKAIKPLLEALKDTESSIRWLPAIYLGDYRDKSVIPYLIEALKKEPELYIQYDLISSLLKLGISPQQEKEVLPYLENILEKTNEEVPAASIFRTPEVRYEFIKKTKDLMASRQLAENKRIKKDNFISIAGFAIIFILLIPIAIARVKKRDPSFFYKLILTIYTIGTLFLIWVIFVWIRNH